VTDQKQTVGNFCERNVISISLTGLADPQAYDRKAAGFDIFDLKSEIDRLFAHLNLDYWNFISYDNGGEYEQSLKVLVNDLEVGAAGKVAKKALSKLDIEPTVYFAQLSLADIEVANKRAKRYHPISKFPFASIDLAFIVNFETPVGELMKALQNVDTDIVQDVSVFDIYSGGGIPEGRKSVAFSVTLGSEVRTLNDSDIARFIARAEETLGKQYSATLRKRATPLESRVTPEEK
jgi:phenylalanyl-tRNA synthetase beta chain